MIALIDLRLDLDFASPYGLYLLDSMRSRAIDWMVTYAAPLGEGRLETLWYMVAHAALSPAEGAPAEMKKLNWWRSSTTRERIRAGASRLLARVAFS